MDATLRLTLPCEPGTVCTLPDQVSHPPVASSTETTATTPKVPETRSARSAPDRTSRPRRDAGPSCEGREPGRRRFSALRGDANRRRDELRQVNRRQRRQSSAVPLGSVPLVGNGSAAPPRPEQVVEHVDRVRDVGRLVIRSRRAHPGSPPRRPRRGGGASSPVRGRRPDRLRSSRRARSGRRDGVRERDAGRRLGVQIADGDEHGTGARRHRRDDPVRAGPALVVGGARGLGAPEEDPDAVVEVGAQDLDRLAREGRVGLEPRIWPASPRDPC